MDDLDDHLARIDLGIDILAKGLFLHVVDEGFNDLAEEFPETDNPNAIIVRVTEDGAVFDIPNASIRDTICNEEGSGAISVALATSVKGLEYNAEELATYYAEKVAEKAQKKAKQAEEKARKIERDKARREAQEAKKAEA